ncbi:hypothetical protein [Streptomyces lavenduligriseus]|nr:hypothetical protein [Streptomyces lavenduligriseus]
MPTGIPRASAVSSLSQVRRSSTAYRQAVSAVIDHIESLLVR